MDYASNIAPENQHSADMHGPSDDILSDKAYLSPSYMIPKVIFAKKWDNNKNDLKLVACSCEHEASRLFARYNQT